MRSKGTRLYNVGRFMSAVSRHDWRVESCKNVVFVGADALFVGKG